MTTNLLQLDKTWKIFLKKLKTGLPLSYTIEHLRGSIVYSEELLWKYSTFKPYANG